MNHVKARVGLNDILSKEIRYDRNIILSLKIAVIPIAIAR